MLDVCTCMCELLSRVRLFATLRTVACQAPPSVGFSRQKHWNGLPFFSPGDLPDREIEPRSTALQADSLPSELPGKPNVWVPRGKTVFYLKGNSLCAGHTL